MIRFTGKERDQESGLDYFGARYYGSALGRFTSPDQFAGGPVDVSTPSVIEQPGPVPYADIRNPQSLNKYVYALNNPLRYTDPDGHCPLCIAVEDFLASPEGEEVGNWVSSNLGQIAAGAGAIAGSATAALSAETRTRPITMANLTMGSLFPRAFPTQMDLREHQIISKRRMRKRQRWVRTGSAKYELTQQEARKVHA